MGVGGVLLPAVIRPVVSVTETETSPGQEILTAGSAEAYRRQ